MPLLNWGVQCAVVWAMLVLPLNCTTQGAERAWDSAQATWTSYPYAQSTTGAIRACMASAPKALLNTMDTTRRTYSRIRIHC